MANNALNEKEKSLQLKGASEFLLGVLLALTIKVAIEVTFKDLVKYNDWFAAFGAVWSDLARNVLVLCQFLVFLFAVLRFYQEISGSGIRIDLSMSVEHWGAWISSQS